MTKILDGKKVREHLAKKIVLELKKLKVKPKLVIIQVGNDERSLVYVKQKKIFGEKLGFEVEYIQFDKNINEEEIISQIKIFNSDIFTNGVIVQLPLPKKIDTEKVIESILPEKDVDGMTSKNIYNLFRNNFEGFIPATTKGILSLLDFYKINLEGKKVVIVGRSLLVGKPSALAFLNRNTTITVCHSKTKNLKKETKNADILISAIGNPRFIKKSFVRKGQIVIDIGITKIGENLFGDVDFKPVSSVVSAITPVPGGIGPMTVVSLFENVLLSYKRQKGLI